MGPQNASTAAQRAQAAATMIAQAGQYGTVSVLSRSLGVSRPTLYRWKEIGQQGLLSAFSPSLPASGLWVPQERAILTLWAEGHAAERGIQTCLEQLGLGGPGLGTISAVVGEAQRRALAWCERQPMPTDKRAIALDEIFTHRRDGAALSIVDAQSLAVWRSAGPLEVDVDSWVLLLWEAQDKGLRWDRTVSDGLRAIPTACALVDPTGCHTRDVWHVLYETSCVQGRVDRQVKRLADRAPTVARQQARVAAGKLPLGRNPLASVAAHAAQVAKARGLADALRYLRQELRRLCEVVVLDHRGLLGRAQRQADLEALLGLLEELASGAAGQVQQELTALHKLLAKALPDVVRWVGALDPIQAEAASVLGQGNLALVAWAWQRRRILGPTTAKLLAQLPPQWREAAGKVMAAWDDVVRASSAVESWHSLLRPHLAVHRRLTPGLLALLAVYHNHRVFTRGAHQGRNPLQISGIADAPTDWLVALAYPPRQGASSHPSETDEPIKLAEAA
jgi:hypothetical protein